jgi:hypothetical protein
MKAAILVSILAVLLVAGCTVPGVPGIIGGGGTSVSGNGMEITSFSTEPTTAYSGNTVRVTMDVQNLGGTSVLLGDTHAFVYLTGSNMNLGSGTDIYWRGSTLATDKQSCRPFTKNMTAADVVKGTEGRTETLKWSLIAPKVDAGQTRTDTIIGRVYTDYETAVNGNIWVYQQSEADAAKASGRSLNRASFTTTSGPVAVSVSVNPDPVIIYSDGDKTTTLTIRISNTASGTIYKSGFEACGANGPTTINSDTQLNKVDVVVSAPDFDGIATCNADQPELIAGKPTTVVCDITVNKAVATFSSFPISVKIKYGYFTERTATVVVQGK